jgi:hypothetical protein
LGPSVDDISTMSLGSDGFANAQTHAHDAKDAVAFFQIAVRLTNSAIPFATRSVRKEVVLHTSTPKSRAAKRIGDRDALAL